MQKTQRVIVKPIILIVFTLNFISCRHDPYQDVTFYSDAFQTERSYRVYLPLNYDQDPDQRYPVIYYFHGFGGRYKWSGHDPEDDIYYPGNGRKEPPYVMEWKEYVEDHQVIIVTWDGYEPNLHPGKKHREGIDYSGSKPYDFIRAHDKADKHWGWDFRVHYRELVKHVDQNFRTIADRDHRAITGLSMGGLTSYYIAGQNKDLVSSVSSFDPADNLPYYGPKGKQAVFPVLEMHRSLKGLPTRLTMTDGDWLKYNDWELKRIFDASDIGHFEFHLADYPDHWAADTKQQLDFHMREFGKSHPIPNSWNHLCPAFPNFEVWGYQVEVQRSQPALTLLEDVTSGHMKALARTYIPDGPIVQDEEVSITTSDIYPPSASYQLITYNLSSGEFDSTYVEASANGRLQLELGGGGHLVGINGPGPGSGAKLSMIHRQNKEYHYFEVGKSYSLDFRLVNVGGESAEDIEIKATSPHPYITINDNIAQVSQVSSGSQVNLKDQFDFSFHKHSDSSFVGALFFEVKVDGVVMDTQRTMFFTTPESSYISEDDIIILDGRTVEDIPLYRQGPNEIQIHSISGGKGNGNGILEPEEDALVHIRLAQGMAPNDTGTFHRTFLVNHLDEPYIHANQLHYEERLNQASKTHIATMLSISDDTPENHEFDLWFKVESLYNDKNDTTSRAAIYGHRYHYRRFRLKVNK